MTLPPFVRLAVLVLPAAALLGLGSPAAAAAGAGGVSAAFGNTLKARYPDGRYHVEVEAADVRGNRGRRELPVSINNAHPPV